MKKIVVVVVIVFAVVVGVYRERIFVRDPLGKVMRNGAKVAGAEVYINFLNDVLVVGDDAEGSALPGAAMEQVAGDAGCTDMHALDGVLDRCGSSDDGARGGAAGI